MQMEMLAPQDTHTHPHTHTYIRNGLLWGWRKTISVSRVSPLRPPAAPDLRDVFLSPSSLSLYSSLFHTHTLTQLDIYTHSSLFCTPSSPSVFCHWKALHFLFGSSRWGCVSIAAPSRSTFSLSTDVLHPFALNVHTQTDTPTQYMHDHNISGARKTSQLCSSLV